jgi:autotransporter-associated beta strand protein
LSGFNGNFDHQAGQVSLSGALGGDYHQAAAATLNSQTGARIAGDADFAGHLRGSLLTVDGNADFNGATLAGLTQAGGDATFNDSIFKPTLSDGNQSSLFTNVTGTATFSGSNTVDLANFKTGTFTLLTATSGLPGASSTFTTPVTINGYALNTRQNASLGFGAQNLTLTVTSGDNAKMLWTDAAGNGLWNLGASNWEDVPDTGLREFAHNDYVVFDTTGAGDIDVQGTAFVSGMEINGGTYRFTGDQIAGTMDKTGNKITATGKLAINGGAATFDNSVAFINGMDIASGASATLTNSGSFGGMAIRNEGNLTIDRSTDYALNGALGGAGTLAKKGAGALTVGGALSATGLLDHQGVSLTLNQNWGGAYQQSAGTTLTTAANVGIGGEAAFRGQVNPHGTLAIGGNAFFDGATVRMTNNDLIAAAGAATFSGANAMDIDIANVTSGTFALLTAANDLTGALGNWYLTPITHNRITADLGLGADNKSLVLNANVANLALTWTGATNRNWDTQASNWSGGETFIAGDQVTFGSAGAGLVQLGQDVTAGQVTIQNGDYTFTGPGALKGRASGNLPGSLGGLTKNGSGTLWLNQSGGSQFEGDVRVQAGTLGLASNLSSGAQFNLASGATLIFEGTLDNNVPRLPKITATAITLNGNLEAKITSLAQATRDQAHVVTVATATGGGLSLNSSNTSGHQAFYDYNFTKNANNLDLTITPKANVSLTSAGSSPNFKAMAGSLDWGLRNGYPFSGELEGLLLETFNAGTLEEANALLAPASGSVLVGGTGLSQHISQYHTTWISRTLGHEPELNLSPSAGGSPPDSWTIQAAAIGTWGEVEGDSGDPGYDLENSSGHLALDYRFDNYRLGLAIIVGQTKMDWEGGGRTEADNTSFTIYGRYDQGPWFATVQATLGQSEVESRRHPYPGLTAKADYDLDWYSLRGVAGYQFWMDEWRATPRIGLTFTHLDLPSVRETGAGTLNLALDSGDKDSLELEAGLLVSRDFAVNSMVATPRLDLGLGVETMNTDIDVATRFVNQPALPAFVNRSPSLGRVRFSVDAGVDLALDEQVTLFVDYQGSFRDNEQTHSGTLGFKVNWE